jgi:hypothetical protein
MLQMLIVGYVSAIMNVIGTRPLIAAMSLRSPRQGYDRANRPHCYRPEEGSLRPAG